MSQKIGSVALLVYDYDEAIEFYTKRLGFVLLEDTLLSVDKRWVRVRPLGPNGTDLLLAKAATPEQKEKVGHQAGGRVFLFLHTDNFWQDYHKLTTKKVRFLESPREEEYGTVAVFEDLYGNRWDLLELKKPN